MNKIGSYEVFKNDFFDRTQRKEKSSKTDRKADSTKKNNKTSAVNQEKQVQLSDKARDLLEKLKKKYTNMDFMVADYETEEEASEYLSRGTKEFSVLIDPETLEEMAADEEVCDKYLGILDDSKDKLSDMMEELGDEKNQIRTVGINIDRDGTVTYFAELEKTNSRQRERLEKNREAKTEKSDKAEKQDEALRKTEKEKRKRAYLQADTVEELMEKIRNINWEAVEEEEIKKTGGRIDFKA